MATVIRRHLLVIEFHTTPAGLWRLGRGVARVMVLLQCGCASNSARSTVDHIACPEKNRRRHESRLSSHALAQTTLCYLLSLPILLHRPIEELMGQGSVSVEGEAFVARLHGQKVQWRIAADAALWLLGIYESILWAATIRCPPFIRPRI